MIMIKILIKSFQYKDNKWDYLLFLNSDEIQWDLYTFAFKNIYYKALKKNTLYSFNEEHYNVDIEMSTCFCLLMNRALHKCKFEVGTPDECLYQYKGFKYYYKDFVPLVSPKAWNSSNSKECIEMMKKLEGCVDEYKLENWEILSRDYDSEDLFNVSLMFNRFRYSIFIEHLIDKHGLDIDSYVPMINGSYHIYGVFDSGAYKYPDSLEVLYDSDLYPLDIAYLSRNDSLLKKLIQKKAKSHATAVDDVLINGKSTNLISHMLDIANSKEDIEFAISLFFDNVINYNPFHMVNDNYCSINDTSRKVLESWYASVVRLGDIEQLNSLISQYPEQIFKMLKYVNPYTAKYNDNNIQEEISRISQFMIDYINEKVIPYINQYNLKQTNYKEDGIWGYDACTGKPIRENDLYI